jgi:oxalate---CoA ligase
VLNVDDYLGLAARASETPLAMALASPGRKPLTYSGLWKHLAAVAEELSRSGAGPGDVIALAVSSGPIAITVPLAVTLRWACAPLDLGLTREEYRASLPRIGASTLIFDDSAADSPVVEVARELGLQLLRLRASTDDPAGVFELDAIENPRRSAANRQLDAKFLLQTSATTGVPKLVPRSRASVLAAAEQDVRALHLSASDRYLSLISLNIGHGLTMIFSQLLCGGAVFSAPVFEPEGFRTWLEDFRPTWFAGGSAVSRMVLALAKHEPQVFSRVPLRFVCSLGAAPEPDMVPTIEKLLGVPVLENYGMTEASGVTRNTLDGRRAGSVGRSTGAEIGIFDEAGIQLPAGREGEVGVRGPTLMSGYLDDPGANQEAFRDGWFRTGDIGRMDHDGYLFIVGRKKEMIDRGGKKIAPQEIDNVLASHPAVEEVAAFAIPHRTLVEDTAAAVVLRPEAQVSALELRRFAATHLAAYKVPRKIVFLDRIPRVTTGKPQRAALSERYRDLGSPEQLPQLEQPASEMEESLASIWRRVLNLDRVGTSDDFFDLGGDSLSAAHMLTQAAAAFELGPTKLPEADFFDQPTISALARYITEHANEGSNEPCNEPALANKVLVLESHGTRLPIFCFSTGEQDAYQFRHLSRWLGPEQPFTVVCPGHPMQGGRLRSVLEIARQSVTSIRALRPHGPYLISGHCYGGVVAFEACRQLIAEGESIAMLILFDTPTPGYPKIKWKQYAQAASTMVSALLRGKKPVTFDEIGEHIQVLNRGTKAPALGEDTPAEAWHPALMSAYQPRMLPAPITHFLGAGVTMSTRVLSDPRMGWRDFGGAGYEAHSVPGDHVSIFSESNAAVLAAELEKTLQDLNSRSAMASV